MKWEQNKIKVVAIATTIEAAMIERISESDRFEALGTLAGGIAHDFNNMLGVILGHAALALEQVPLDAPLRGDLEEIQAAAKRSADLTRQLLAFARKQAIQPVVLDLNATVAGMLRLLQRILGEDIQLAWRPGEGLWPTMADPSQLDQILANLCVNARDAIAGVGRITIETANATLDAAACARHHGLEPGEFVRLSVSDDGTLRLWGPGAQARAIAADVSASDGSSNGFNYEDGSFSRRCNLSMVDLEPVEEEEDLMVRFHHK